MSSRDARCIVVVDDDESMRQALARILRLAGYKPLAYASAEALLAATVADKAACLILDVHLPILTGFELYERLNGMGITPPVIFISAYDEPENEDYAKSAGALAYFVKPFSGHALVAEICRTIGAPAADAGA